MDEADVFMGSVLNDVFGELEDKYETKSVDEVSLNVRYGYTDSAKDKGNAVFIRITDINENGKFKDNFVYVDIEDKELNKYKLYKGDILVARSGATAGKVALFDLDFVSVFASYLIRIQPNEEMDSSFFFYFCHSPKYWNQLNVIKVGGAQPNVNATNLKKIKIATPPLNIQQKVVKYLDEISEKIEKVKSVQKEKMDSLKALKASILDKAFRGEL
jgi:type I restriction enzyme S subunit